MHLPLIYLLEVNIVLGYFFSGTDGKCPYIVTIQNGSVSYLDQRVRNDIGGTVIFRCLDGWLLVGNDHSTCLADGRWRNDPPICKFARCPVFRGLDNGRTVVYNNVIGGRADFLCDPGHRLVGRETITCMENQFWSHALPKCIPAICPAISLIRNGRISERFSNDVGSVVNFRCDKGYALHGHATLTCLKSLHWDHSVPFCECDNTNPDQCEIDEINKCPYIVSIPYGAASQSGVKIGSWVKFTCKSRFKLKGKRRLKCLEGGQFRGQIPKCVEHTCPHFEHFENGVVLNSDSTRVNSFIKVKCNRGYSPGRVEFFKCQDVKLTWWRPTDCAEFRCPDVLTFQNGYIEGYTNEVNKSFRWKCDPGFVLRQAHARQRAAAEINRCNGNQRWNNPDVVCLPKE